MARRGPYFRYLVDPNVEVPESTLRSRNIENLNHPVDGIEDQGIQQPLQEDDSPGSGNSSGRSSPLSDVHFFNHSPGHSTPSAHNSPASDMHLSNSSERSSPLIDNQNSSSDFHMSAQSDVSDGSVSEQESEDLQESSSDRASNSSHSDRGDSDVNSENDVNSESDVDSDSGYEERDPGAFHDDDFPPNAPRIPMYNGCRITLEESRFLIMSFALRFSLSDKGIEFLLNLINCHLPHDEYESMYLFKKHIPPPRFDFKLEFVCSEDKCQRLVKFENGVNNVVCECGVQCNKKTLQKDGHSFLTLPLKNQIVSMFENVELSESLRWDSRTESDVFCGSIYQTGLNSGALRRECDITLQFNTDGVQMFKTSSIEVWPIQVAVNELPFKLRRENIMLCGLWYGKGKPNMNSFLLPFVEELNDLHLNGINLPTNPPRLIKVHTILSSVDSMARAPLQNLKTFRGAYGCAFCLHPGEECAVGRGTTRLYRGDLQRLRNARQHQEDVTTILRRNNRVVRAIHGIKGPSVLMLLNCFDISQSFVPDYLHCVLLGVVKTTVKFWTLGRNSGKPFYLGNDAKLNAIDEVLLSIKPPSELTKTPRSIHVYKLWRGHEWKNFLLYYSIPCLMAVNFPTKYLNHWCLLVYSMFCFLSDVITPEKFENGKRALRKYVLTVEEVYGGPELMKYNTHLLLHVPRSVRQFGALWASSTFPFEHYNGMLAKMFRSSQAVPLQICKNYLRIQGLKEELNNIAHRVPHCMKEFLSSLTCGKSSKHALRMGVDLVLSGAPAFGLLSLVQQNEIENLISAPINNTAGNVYFYEKFFYKNVKHHVEGCTVLKKRINCVVQIHDGTFTSITHAVKIVTTEDIPRTLAILLGNKLHSLNNALSEDRELGLSSNLFVTVVRKTNECVALWPHMIGRKCVLTFYPGDSQKYCCFPLVNLIERD